MMRKLLLMAGVAVAAVTPLAASVSPASAQPLQPSIARSSGQHCTDSYGYSADHVCGAVDGTGMDVLDVQYRIDAVPQTTGQSPWCGEAKVVATYANNTRTWESPHGCSGTASTLGQAFSGTINTYLNMVPATSGTVKIYAISDPGRPVYSGYVVINIHP